MFDKYVDRKAKGMISIAKVGDTAIMSANRFNPDTGEKLTPTVAAIDAEAIKKDVEKLQEQIDNLNAVIKDAEAIVKAK